MPSPSLTQGFASLVALMSRQAATNSDRLLATIGEMVAVSGLDRHDVRVLCDQLVAADEMHWYGPVAQCAACHRITISLGMESRLVCSCHQESAQWIMDEAYYLVEPGAVLQPRLGAALTLAELSQAVALGAFADGDNHVYNMGSQLPSGYRLTPVTLVERNVWYVTPIVGRIAYTLYGVRQSAGCEAVIPIIAADLGSVARYDALCALEALDPDLDQIVPLLTACASLADLTDLPAFWAATARIGLIAPDISPSFQSPLTGTLPMIEGSRPMASIERQGTLMGIPDHSAWRIYAAYLRLDHWRYQTIFAFPWSDHVLTLEKQFKGDWCRTTTHLLLANPADAFQLWQRISLQ